MIEPIKITLSKTAETDMKTYLRRTIRSLKQGSRELFETKVPRWRKSYEAQPAEQVREFPWHNASNLVVPIIAIHADTLLARVMAAVLKTQPLWVARLLGTHPDEMQQFRTAIELFLQYVGIEPEELDLFRVYQEWFGETIRLGTSVVKVPWIKDVQETIIAGDTPGSIEHFPEVKYKGPRPEKLRFEDFLISPTAKTIEGARFKAHILRLQREDLEERSFRKDYDPKAVTEVLKSPDRTSPRNSEQMQQSDAGARVVSGYGFAEWDVYECHFKYRVPGIGYTKLMVWYHESTDTLLRAFYYYYPTELFIGARLFYRDDFWYGYGFCEMLENFQEEISTIHNQRRDNMTVCNTQIWRVDPDSPLHKGYRIFPSAMLPAAKDEIEGMTSGSVSPMAIDEERLSLELAEKRSGVSNPMQGFGAGTMSKRGVYSAMGTLSLLQEGNTRTDLNVTDIRYSHTKVGRVVLSEYAEFGIGDRASQFGSLGEKLSMALEFYKNRKIALPVYASTASVNREVEKQNDLMLTGIMQKHYAAVTQMLQAASNMMSPEDVKSYIPKAIKGLETLMEYVMRHFGYDEVDRIVPSATPTGGQPKPGEQPMPQSPGAPQMRPPMPPQPGGNGAAMTLPSSVLTGGAK